MDPKTKFYFELSRLFYGSVRNRDNHSTEKMAHKLIVIAKQYLDTLPRR